MRILFICTSIEPGLDGVGDYVRLLAGACIGFGHECAVIALYDRYVIEPSESVLKMQPGSLAALRLPATESWPTRIQQARAFRSKFKPDVISLQIVPYGFDAKGILFKVVPFFRILTTGCLLHIMFHELWIGIAKLSPARHRVVGALQKQGLKRMLSHLEPQLVTTSNSVFVSMLATVGVSATLLPLFGNVPVESKVLPGLPQPLIDAGITRDGSARSAWWLGLFFGTLHPEWQSEPFLGLLRRASRRSHKRVALILVGRAGSAGEKKWEAMRRLYRSDFLFVNLGEQPAPVISVLMQSADFGIAASPWQLLGKSGTVAAMLDHGLPVVVTRDDFQTTHCRDKDASLDPLVHRCDATLETKLRSGLSRQSPRPRLEEIASRFCGLLEKISLPSP